jgi:ribosomal protein S6E (S10)
MFLQVIDGKVADPAGFAASLDRWVEELSPGATGWLGTTSGSYGDGSFIALVRFESAQAAQANSDRPEQGEWWSTASGYLDGDASFENFDEVLVMGTGGSDDAGFVQIMRGHVADVEKERAMVEKMSSMPEGFRPDIIGGIEGLNADGAFVTAIYFTSEAEAREGEKAPMPPDVQAMMEEGQSNSTDMTFTDLKEPAFQSPS